MGGIGAGEKSNGRAQADVVTCERAEDSGCESDGGCGGEGGRSWRGHFLAERDLGVFL